MTYTHLQKPPGRRAADRYLFIALTSPASLSKTLSTDAVFDKGMRNRAERGLGVPLRVLLFLMTIVIVSMSSSGCATRSSASAAEGQKADNIYKLSTYLPPDVRRVAVLPISVERDDWQADSSRPQLETVLQEELGRVKKFELVAVTSAQLELWTGKSSWQAEEKLPATFLGTLHDKLGCDAVLFSHLRPYHAFQPIVLGWNLKLVDARRQEILWSADEVFDASQAAVASQARHFENGGGFRTWFSSETGTILLSPRQFCQFTLNTLLATLPER